MKYAMDSEMIAMDPVMDYSMDSVMDYIMDSMMDPWTR